MGIKKYVVRAGFNYRQRIETEKGTVERIYNEGDPLTLEQEEGDAAHQLEYANDKDRSEALSAESEARKALDAAQPAAGGIDHDALAGAISTGIATAFANLQAARGG